MIKVGLTGNRYSGKDRIAKLFEQISIPVFHADIVLKFILQYNLEIDKQIKIELGQSLFDLSGHLDPQKFNTSEKFNRLLDIVEPELFKAYDKFQLKHQEKGIYTIFHSSILFERDWNKKMDYTITTFSPKTDRIDRANREEPLLLTSVIYGLMAKEIDDLEKNRLSTYVIHNYDDAVDVIKQVDGIDQQIIDKFLKAEQTVQKPKSKLKTYPL
jgi:dephospho-CoA kinase